MNLKDSIKMNSNEFLSLCKSHDVKTLYAFGSSTNDQFKEESSDIDLLVEIVNGSGSADLNAASVAVVAFVEDDGVEDVDD